MSQLKAFSLALIFGALQALASSASSATSDNCFSLRKDKSDCDSTPKLKLAFPPEANGSGIVDRYQILEELVRAQSRAIEELSRSVKSLSERVVSLEKEKK